jgi:hypothetical protein
MSRPQASGDGGQPWNTMQESTCHWNSRADRRSAFGGRSETFARSELYCFWTQCRHVRLGILQRKCRFRTHSASPTPKPTLMEHARGNVPFRPVATGSTTHEAPRAVIRHCHGCYSPLACRVHIVSASRSVRSGTFRLVVPT